MFLFATAVYVPSHLRLEAAPPVAVLRVFERRSDN